MMSAAWNGMASSPFFSEIMLNQVKNGCKYIGE
jgi:hypothetical protein